MDGRYWVEIARQRVTVDSFEEKRRRIVK